ncbi:MAG: hypothetical protein ACRC26_05420 [Bacteroidales bacterium]
MGKTVNKMKTQIFTKLYQKALDSGKQIIHVSSLNEVIRHHQKATDAELSEGKKIYYSVVWRHNGNRYIDIPSGLYICKSTNHE